MLIQFEEDVQLALDRSYPKCHGERRRPQQAYWVTEISVLLRHMSLLTFSVVGISRIDIRRVKHGVQLGHDRCGAVSVSAFSVRGVNIVVPPVLTRYTVRPKPQQLALNCNSSLVSAIDASGVLTVQDLEAKVMQRAGFAAAVGAAILVARYPKTRSCATNVWSGATDTPGSSYVQIAYLLMGVRNRLRTLRPKQPLCQFHGPP